MNCICGYSVGPLEATSFNTVNNRFEQAPTRLAIAFCCAIGNLFPPLQVKTQPIGEFGSVILSLRPVPQFNNHSCTLPLALSLHPFNSSCIFHLHQYNYIHTTTTSINARTSHLLNYFSLSRVRPPNIPLTLIDSSPLFPHFIFLSFFFSHSQNPPLCPQFPDILTYTNFTSAEYNTCIHGHYIQ